MLAFHQSETYIQMNSKNYYLTDKHMRQLIIASSLIGSFLIFSMVVNLLVTLVMFLLFGILPGRPEPVSANNMLAIYTAATIVVAGYAFRSNISSLSSSLRTRSQRSNA